MDTITHGIAGALISKAIFRGGDLFARRPMNRARIITWSLMLGAIFPDSDTLRDIFSKNQLLVITWHRSITHSFVCMPFFAVTLAALTRWVAKRFHWEAPSLAMLTGIYAIGIASHIFLDLVTSFGTMIWSPLNWSRPAWDLLFIVDFLFAAILLVPQFVAWVHADPSKTKPRALLTLQVFALGPLLIFTIARLVGAPISWTTVIVAETLLAALFFLPLRNGWGVRVQQATWSRVGLLAACVYLALVAVAHHKALGRVKEFATFLHADVESIGALPLPPSLWHWDGLVRTPRGVYEARMDLSEKTSIMETNSGGQAEAIPIQYRYFPDSPPNSYIEAAERLPEVQKVLWFSRFPVTQFHQENGDAIVEISDARFPRMRQDRAAPFTYRVRFGPQGNVLSQGWVRE